MKRPHSFAGSRVLVLDDPIQAIDPSKIDGFLQVLIRLAENRQVIVFTHDDRLPSAIRLSRSPAGIVELVRGANSVVTVTESTRPPADRLLEDAFAIAVDEAVPARTAYRGAAGARGARGLARRTERVVDEAGVRFPDHPVETCCARDASERCARGAGQEGVAWIEFGGASARLRTSASLAEVRHLIGAVRRLQQQ